jgi:hypothetical protein
MEPVPMQPIRGRSLAAALANAVVVQANVGTKPPVKAAAPESEPDRKPRRDAP